jgi:L-seryl-tRNA(Ser) seleniumtransferase
VDELASSIGGAWPRELVVRVCREAVNEAREAIQREGAEPGDLRAHVVERLDAIARPSLRRAINATGVILHTNLGRAPLPEFESPTGYCNLEYDLATGKRGRRDSHTEGLLERLLGRPAILVNNCAAAVWLALHELAAGGEVIVSRGEMIEIGDGFRIPDIMTRSGAALVEVGTTNRTRIEDYRRAITLKTRLILRVHPSNFRVEGFTGRPELRELCELGRERGIPVFEDLGSGCVRGLSEFGIVEPTIAESFRAGVDLVAFSGDKILGGPQAGILAGRAEVVQRLRRNPMFRALRVDKLVIGAMEAALRDAVLERWERIPVQRMLRQSEAEVRRRAEALAKEWGEGRAEVAAGRSLLGGGSTPDQSLATALLVVKGDAVGMERRLRANETPVIARIEDDRLVIDLRTVAPEEERELLAALRRL